jgi:pimeloyl-ACP methyl ester carboxylesterase
VKNAHSPNRAEARASTGDGRSIFVSAPDGLRLHVREYGPRTRASTVVCLPGLTRTTNDFIALAPALAHANPERLVIAIDSRGRGQSQYDPNPKNYNLAVEMADVIAVLTQLQIGSAIFVGSSRGGILTMLLAAVHPEMITGAVLHDIGPVIESQGVARIKSYVGKLRQPRTLQEGAEVLRELFGTQFPKLTAAQWLGAAQRTWDVQAIKLVQTYDPALAETLADFDVEHPLAPLWNEFDALAVVPVLVIRGANSDILSKATVAEMQARHPNLEVMEVADQGHVPLLDGPNLINRIGAFVKRCDDEARARRHRRRTHLRQNSLGRTARRPVVTLDVNRQCECDLVSTRCDTDQASIRKRPRDAE